MTNNLAKLSEYTFVYGQEVGEQLGRLVNECYECFNLAN